MTPREHSQRSKLENPTHAKSDPVHVHKPSVTVKSSVKNKKLKQNVLSNRAEIHKLEESYWAKWKPTKSKTDKQNMKPTATPPQKNNRIDDDSFEKKKHHFRVIPKKQQNDKERGDSNDDGSKQHVTTKQEKPEKTTKDSKPSETEKEQKPSLPLILSEENLRNEASVEKSESKDSKNSVDHDGVKVLKHTDSFILTSKKQNQEKSHYQQPKCIKLYKNSSAVSTPKNYIKGGTYPLKSCLKKEKPMGNIRLGRPGSPLVVQSFSSNKAGRKKK